MKNCIYCEGEIWDHVKKCKHCWEWLITPSKKTSKDSNVEHHNTSIIEQIKESWLFIGIALVILMAMLKPSSSVTSSMVNPSISSWSLYEVDWQFESDSSKNKTFVTIESIKDWYVILDMDKNVILSYTGNEVEVKSKMIWFADKINSWEPISIPWWNEWLAKEVSTIWILIDNTYAQSYNWIDTSWPDKRIISLKSLLPSRISDNSKVKVGFVYSVRIPKDWESVAPDSTYTFEINKQYFPSVLKSNKVNGVWVDYIRTNFKIDDGISIQQTATMKDGSPLKDIACDTLDNTNFVCYTVNDMINQLEIIYKEKYQNLSTTHSWNLLLEYLAAKNFYALKDIYIFTDGQFEIGDKIKMGNLLKWVNWDYKIGSLAKEYPISVFNAFTYDHYQNNNLFKNYWTAVIQKISKEYISCNSNNVILIGLLDTSASFKNFAEEFYKNTIFKWCNVSFVSN